MAHFAEVKDGIVQRVLVVPEEEQDRGHQYLAVDLLLGGTWIQCSYNGRIRKQYPGIGYAYDSLADVFVAPRPFASWSLDTNNDWRAPVPQPAGDWRWNEATGSWVPL